MKDSETHELKLCKALTDSIQQLCYQYGEGIIHESVYTHYRRIIQFREDQLKRDSNG